MKYISGNITDELQGDFYYKIKTQFKFGYCLYDKRVSDLTSNIDFDNFTSIITTNANDIIHVKYFGTSTAVFCFLVNVIHNDEIIEYNTETILFKQTLDINPDYFENITISKKRNDKINKLLNDSK